MVHKHQRQDYARNMVYYGVCCVVPGNRNGSVRLRPVHDLDRFEKTWLSSARSKGLGGHRDDANGDDKRQQRGVGRCMDQDITPAVAPTTRERSTPNNRRRSSPVSGRLAKLPARKMKVAVAAVVNTPPTSSHRTAALCIPIASAQMARRARVAPKPGRPAAGGRQPHRHESELGQQRYGESICDPLRPNDLGRRLALLGGGLPRGASRYRGDIDAASEPRHRRQHLQSVWRASVTSDAHAEKREIPGHEGGEHPAQGDETDRVHCA
jgi:hypothetical protein